MCSLKKTLCLRRFLWLPRGKSSSQPTLNSRHLVSSSTTHRTIIISLCVALYKEGIVLMLITWFLRLVGRVTFSGPSPQFLPSFRGVLRSVYIGSSPNLNGYADQIYYFIIGEKIFSGSAMTTTCSWQACQGEDTPST